MGPDWKARLDMSELNSREFYARECAKLELGGEGCSEAWTDAHERLREYCKIDGKVSYPIIARALARARIEERYPQMKSAWL